MEKLYTTLRCIIRTVDVRDKNYLTFCKLTENDVCNNFLTFRFKIFIFFLLFNNKI